MSAVGNTSLEADVKTSTSVSTVSGLTALGVLVLVATGDFLLWDGWFGISWALYLLLVTAVQIALHIRSTPSKTIGIGVLIALVSIAPVVENFSTLSAVLSTLGVFSGCLVIGNCFSKTKTLWLSELISRGLAAPAKFPKLVSNYFRSRDVSSSLVGVTVWIVPVILTLVFVLLFTEASPVWKSWWNAIDLSNIFDLLFSTRWMSWMVLAWFTLPFLANRLPRPVNIRHMFIWAGSSVEPDILGGKQLAKKAGVSFFIRCLILFNLVFAVQTLLDLQFLWGGVELPEGMTYAQYAHRGAYPLIVAALLAAVFVLITTRPGGAGEQSAMVKWLVIGWVGQVLMLVFSSVERLNLYVAAYAMTYWRIAAFIWMGLVAVGLMLIVLRFVTGKSCQWLLITNLSALLLTLYMTSFVNLPGFIASYNLNHSRIVMAKGSVVDWHYLRKLGPDTYPAVVQFIASQDDALSNFANTDRLAILQGSWGRYYQTFPDRDWRNWSFRQQRAYWVWERFGNQPAYSSKGERAAP